MKNIKRFIYFFASRLAWFFAMLCLAFVGLFSPQYLMDMLEVFAQEERGKDE